MMILTLWPGVANAEGDTTGPNFESGYPIIGADQAEGSKKGVLSSSVSNYVYENEIKFTTDSSTLAGDTTPPAFAEGYPKLGTEQTAGSKKIEVLIKGILPEGETGLGYVLLADGDLAPTPEQIRSAYGKIPGVTVITWAQQLIAGSELPITLTGVQDDTDYEFYAVCWKDDVFSEVGHLAVKTPAAGSGDPGTPVLAPPTGVKWDTADGIKAKWNAVEDATSYSVTLYKEGYSTMLIQYPELAGTEVSVQSNIAGRTGNYYFTVQAIAEGYTSSLTPASPSYSYIAPLYGNATIDNMNPKVGDTLTGSLVYGNNTGTLHYAWKVGGELVEADAASYTVTAADLGKTITLEITSSVETGTRTSTATAEVAAPAVWKVSNVAELENALGGFKDGDTIQLTQNITYNQGIIIEAKSFCLDLGSYTLDVLNSTGIGIDIKDAILTVSGDGKLNAIGTKGVQAHNSKISVYSATGTAGAGVEASCSSYAGGAPCEVTVTAHAQGTTAGVYAMNDNCKITAGSAKATATNGKAVYAEVGGTVEISGDVEALNGHGVYCVNSSATIGGNVTSKNTAVFLYEKGSIVINGKVNADNGSGTAVEIDGNGNPSNGTVTIEGTVSALDASYVCFVNGVRTKNEGVPDGAYLKYMDSIDGEKAGIIRVRKVPAVCTIGAQEFTSLSDAVAAAPDGEITTITMLQSITHTKHIMVEKKTINLDLMDYDLLLDTSANTSYSPALMVIDGGEVNLIGSGTGEFNIKSYMTAISAIGIDSKATVHNVVAGDGNGVNMVGSGDNLDSDSTVTVLGSITVGNGNGVDMNAKNGKVVVGGNITAGRIGVFIASNPGTQVTVNGDITVIDKTPDNLSELIGIRAYGNTTVAVKGNLTVRGSSCVGVHALGGTINIDGNVVSSGIGAKAEPNYTYGNGEVTIHGSLSGNPFIVVGNIEKTADEVTEISEGFLVYTDGKSTVRIGSVGVPASTYTVTVTGGSGSGEYAEGEEVCITADAPELGKEFKEWTGMDGLTFTEGSKDTATAKFTMPDHAVTVVATYKDKVVIPDTYTVILNSGGTGASGAGNYKKDAIVNIYAGERSGYNFNGWTSLDGVTFANADSATTTFTMPAKDVTITANWKNSSTSGSSSGGGGGSPKPSVPTINTVVKAGNYQQNYPITIDASKKSAVVSLNPNAFNTAFEKAEAGRDGSKTVNITFPAVQDTNSYTIELSASTLGAENASRNINISCELGNVTLPCNMLKDTGLATSDNIEITISKADKSKLPESVRNIIGNRPVIELRLAKGSQTIAWNNPAAPVVVTIPYTPTKEELLNPEQITIWYIDSNGNVVSVPSGRYDPATGTVTFSTTHFSKFAIVYVTKTFDDLENVIWAKKPIEILASKGILQGISNEKYAPQTNITRADFLCFLIRTLGVEANFTENFEDVKKDAYYYKEIGIAKKLGITSGTGNNKYSPNASITRQDMITLTVRALKLCKGLQEEDEISNLNKFTDKSLLADYSVNSIAIAVKEGLIVGSNNQINPKGNTTRAEAAVFLYKIYNK